MFNQNKIFVVFAMLFSFCSFASYTKSCCCFFGFSRLVVVQCCFGIVYFAVNEQSIIFTCGWRVWMKRISNAD